MEKTKTSRIRGSGYRIKRSLRHISRVVILIFAAVAGLFGPICLAQTKADDRSNQRNAGHSRKYVNKIPYDVFFDDPLQLVASGKDLVVEPESSPEKSNESQTNTSVAATAGRHEGTQWHLLLPMSELQSEVKSIRNSLSKSLANPGQFRQNIKTIAIDSNELAALAAIVQGHDEPLGWKDKSQYVRDFSMKISQSAAGLSKEDFDKTKLAFQQLSTVLDGSIPVHADEIPSVRQFHEVASRKGLMKRIERGKDWLKQDVNSEAKFKSMSDQIRHETAILAALATIITKAGYNYTDDDDYQAFAKQLIDGAKEAADASSDGAYEKFKPAIDKVNKSCTDCHGTYGNS